MNAEIRMKNKLHKRAMIFVDAERSALAAALRRTFGGVL